MAILPCDVRPYVDQAIARCRTRITALNQQIASPGTASAEEIAAWTTERDDYDRALTELLQTLEV
jgi:hypothetical protein